MGKKAKRSRYDASRRRQRALESQERVLEAARRSFAERGYVETTMEQIAEQAGVAVPTIYAAFGSKRGILAKLVDRLVSGEVGGPGVLQTAKASEVLGNPDRQRALTDYANHMGEILARVAPVHFMIKNAARTEPELAALHERMQRGRFKNMQVLADVLKEKGPLREPLTPEDAARTIWVLSSAEVRQLLLEHGGLSEEGYASWLAQTLIASLLP